MTVYLVPAAHGRHELYCEVAPLHHVADASTGTFWGRLVDRFRRLIEEGEAERAGRHPDDPSRGRVRRYVTRKVAEAVAEQRLLWHLRHVTAVDLLHADDMAAPAAERLLRDQLGADLAKHRRWGLVDAVLMGITGPLFFFVPGPNVVSWYFLFRAVGHYFAWRGANQGLRGVVWTTVPSPALTELRAAIALEGELRRHRVEEIAAALGLDRLPIFMQKVA